MKKIYVIKLNGCDDVTTVDMSLDETELGVLESLQSKVNDAARYNCQPTMSIEEKL